MRGAFGIIFAFTVVFIVRINARDLERSFKSCQQSSECGKNHCCRNDDGKVLVQVDYPSVLQHDNRMRFEMIIDPVGKCRPGMAHPQEICDDSCQCIPEYVCFQPLGKACCEPRRCIHRDVARVQLYQWQKCNRNPACLERYFGTMFN